jgi:hypothetical protein
MRERSMATHDIRHSSPDSASAGLNIVDLAPKDPRWTDFVANHPDALLYHHPAWFEVLRETFGYTPAALGCTDGTGRLSGVLPLLQKRSLLAGLHLSSLPHTPVAGPLANDGGSLRVLLAAAAGLVDGSHARWLQLKVAEPCLDGLVEGFSRDTWDATYVLDLPDDPEQLRFGSARNHSRIQWAVRKSARLGVTVREASSLEDVRRWYRLYLGTMRAHATPPRPFRLFQSMWELLAPRQLFRLLLAERCTGGRTDMLAGSVFLLHGRTIVYAFNGRDHAQLGFRPNDAIHWHAIAEACASGFRRYDFGEVTGRNDGLVDFKEKWRAKPAKLYRYYYPARREIERGLLEESSVVRAAAEWAWRRLPLPVTAGAGRWIYRRL